jgi:purine-binding chemotaxis protein CheW
LREAKDTGASEDRIEVLEFQLAHETFAIELHHISEVFPLKELTPLPCVPPFVLGIINVRGRILPVIDIKKFIDLPSGGLTDLNKVIILNNEEMELGILADSILGLRLITPEETKPPTSAPAGVHAEYLKGVTGERLVILDASKILNDKRIIVNEHVEV